MEHKDSLSYAPAHGLDSGTASAGGTWYFSVLETQMSVLRASQDLFFFLSPIGWRPCSYPDPLRTRVPIKGCKSIPLHAQGSSGIPEMHRPRVIVQGQLHHLMSTAQGCLLPQAETPTADLQLAEFTHRRLLRAAPASLFTLRNTSGRLLWPSRR